MAQYDTIVVGAGVEGLYTAYHLAMRNKKTLLLEQFPMPHSRGSSHGQSRINRKAYTQNYYADMMLDAYPQWKDLENRTKTQLFVKTGLLVACTKNFPHVRDTHESLERIRASHNLLSLSELRKRFPMMRFYDDYEAVIDYEAGVLRADRVLKALQNQFILSGGILQDDEAVIKIIPGQDVTIVTSKGQYQARSVVLCAGPWTSKLIEPLGLKLPLEVKRIGVYYWQTKFPQYSVTNGFPSLIYHGDADIHVYALPALEYPKHIKIGRHSGPVIDPDRPDAVFSDEDTVTTLSKFARKHLPGVEDKPSIKETCMYTVTPDENFILDKHPKFQNVVIGAGFSGHGFKLAPVVGKLLSELASGIRPSHDLGPFGIERFTPGQATQSKL